MRIELTNPFAARGITVATKKLQVSRRRCRKRKSAQPNFATCLQLWLSAVMALHPSSSTAPVSGAPTSSTSGLSSAHPVLSLGSSVIGSTPGSSGEGSASYSNFVVVVVNVVPPVRWSWTNPGCARRCSYGCSRLFCQTVMPVAGRTATADTARLAHTNRRQCCCGMSR